MLNFDCRVSVRQRLHQPGAWLMLSMGRVVRPRMTSPSQQRFEVLLT